MLKSTAFWIVIIASLLTIFCGPLTPAQPSGKPKAQGQSSEAVRQNRQTIPVQIPHLIFVSVKVKNSEPLRFILDSASTWSFLDSGLATTLGLKTEGQRSLEGAGENSFNVQFAHDIPLDISGVRLDIKDLAITSLSNKPYKGLLGADLFKQFVVEIDYQKQVVNLFEPRNFKYVGSGEILPLKLRDNIPEITASITTTAHPTTIKALLDVDTGASQTILLARPFVEANQLLASTTGMLRIGAGGLGGGSSYLLGRTKSFKLGRYIFKDWLAGFWQDQRGAGAATDRDGVLGNGVLKRFKVIFDYSRQRLILEPNDLINVPFDYDWCGFNIVADGKNFRIDRVLPGTQAQDGGLQTGDLILSVDGKLLSTLKLAELRRLFKQDGREHLLKIKRNVRLMQLKLKTLAIR